VANPVKFTIPDWSIWRDDQLDSKTSLTPGRSIQYHSRNNPHNVHILQNVITTFTTGKKINIVISIT